MAPTKTKLTNLSNTSLPSLHHEGKPSARAHLPPVPNLSFRGRPFSATFSFRSSASVSAGMEPLPSSPASTMTSPAKRPRWNRRSRQAQVPPLALPIPLPKPRGATPTGSLTRRDVELGVRMIDGDDGWALLVHHPNPKKELELGLGGNAIHNPPPKNDLALDLGGNLVPPLSPDSSPREHAATFNDEALTMLEGKRYPTPVGLQPSADRPGHNLHSTDELGSGLQSAPATVTSYADANANANVPEANDNTRTIPPRRQSLPPAPPSAYLRPPPGRPVSVIAAPVTQAPVSCLHRQSLPPSLDGSRPSIKFAEDLPTDTDARPGTVASLNETLRLRRSYASLEARHANLYEAAVDARNEIARLRARLAHSQDVMERLIDWGLAMQTENEVLREQIPEAGPVGAVTVKSADELRALFNVNFADDQEET